MQVPLNDNSSTRKGSSGGGLLEQDNDMCLAGYVTIFSTYYNIRMLNMYLIPLPGILIFLLLELVLVPIREVVLLICIIDVD